MAAQKLHASKSTSKSLRNIAPDDGQLEDEEHDEDDNDEERDEDDNDEDNNDEDKDNNEEDEDGDGDNEAVEQHNSVHIFPLDFR